MTPSDQTRPVRLALTRKRAVVRDSVTVVRHAARALQHNRFLHRVILGFVLSVVPALVAWRLFGVHPSASGRRAAVHSVVVGARALAVMALQFIVAGWLYAQWTDRPPAGISRMRGALLRRIPGFAICAAFLAWCDRAASATNGVSIARGAVSFGFTYVLSYAVPACAVFGVGILRAFQRTYWVLRTTFGADVLAWSGVWMVTAAMALLAAIPDALDIYSPRAPGAGISLLGRVVNWFVLMPAGISAQAIASAFCTVILFAVVQHRAPAGFPTPAVETVSGLQLAG